MINNYFHTGERKFYDVPDKGSSMHRKMEYDEITKFLDGLPEEDGYLDTLEGRKALAKDLEEIHEARQQARDNYRLTLDQLTRPFDI